MPEYVEEQDESTEEEQPRDEQPQHPSQPLEIQPDGTWILGRGADRWIPSENQMGDLRWLVERDLRNELGVPPTWAEDAEKIEFHRRQLALLDLARQAPRCEHVFTDGRCCKAPRVKKGKLCYAHTLMEEKRPLELNLPPLEDANAVMLWLMDVLRGLAEGRTSEKTAGIMLYGLQLAMVNARFTTFRDTNHAEMVRTVKKPQRTQRNTKKEDFTAEVAGNAEEATGDFTAKGAKAAKKKGQQGLTTAMLSSGAKSQPQRTQRNTKKEDFTAEVAENAEEATGDFTAKGAKAAKKEEQRAVTAENAEIAEVGGQGNSGQSGIEKGPEPQNEEVNPGLPPHHAKTPRAGDPGLPPHHAKTPRAGDPGVESAKSLFSGVEVGEGVADDHPGSPLAEPSRKGSQSEALIIPKNVEHHAGR